MPIRDRGFDPTATASQQKISLEAARFLDGSDQRSGTTFNFGVNVTNQVVGYVIDLSEHEGEAEERRRLYGGSALPVPQPVTIEQEASPQPVAARHETGMSTPAEPERKTLADPEHQAVIRAHTAACEEARRVEQERAARDARRAGRRRI